MFRAKTPYTYAQDKITDYLTHYSGVMGELRDFYSFSKNPLRAILLFITPGVNKLSVFVNAVKTGGMFDIKNQSEWQYQYGSTTREKAMTEYMYYNSRLWSAEQLGNFAFGYFGAAYGYGVEFLGFGAGMYQIVSGTSDWSFFSSYFDDPIDNAYIRLGHSQYWSR